MFPPPPPVPHHVRTELKDNVEHPVEYITRGGAAIIALAFPVVQIEVVWGTRRSRAIACAARAGTLITTGVGVCVRDWPPLRSIMAFILVCISYNRER